LRAGDVGAVVHVHAGGPAFELEFVTFTGRTIAVVMVEAAQVRPVGNRDVSHVRELAAVWFCTDWSLQGRDIPASFQDQSPFNLPIPATS
jgi:hypothetical protein